MKDQWIEHDGQRLVLDPDLVRPRPIAEYHEDMGPVLWWWWVETREVRGGDLCVDGHWGYESPYVGAPGDLGFTVEAHTTTRIITQVNQEHDPEPVIHRINVGGWPGYHTHWTPIPKVVEPTASVSAPAPDPVRTALADHIEANKYSIVFHDYFGDTPIDPDRRKLIVAALRAAPQPVGNPLVSGMRDELHNLTTHRDAWRQALEIARYQAGDSRDDMDEKGYWTHELRAFDRTFAAILSLPPSELPLQPTKHSEGWQDISTARDPLSEQQRHAVEHARYQVVHATPDDSECCFDYQLVETLVEIIDRGFPAIVSEVKQP